LRKQKTHCKNGKKEKNRMEEAVKMWRICSSSILMCVYTHPEKYQNVIAFEK
jgi:hypothetical protein